MLSLFQLMAEEDQVNRGQVTYIVRPEAAGDTENDLYQDAITSLAIPTQFALILTVKLIFITNPNRKIHIFSIFR